MADPVTTLTPDTLPAVEERRGVYRTTGGRYVEWCVWEADYYWRTRAACSAPGSPWGVTVENDPAITPAEACRLAEYVTRAAAYCEQQERQEQEEQR